MDIRTTQVAANGMTFEVLEAGEGPLILCLHGFPDHPATWRDMLLRLAAAGYRAAAPVMRGFAPAVRAPDASYQTWATGADVLALIDAFAAGPAVVIGHDWGASAAYAAAAIRPEAIRRLVTLAVPYGPALRLSLIEDGDQQRRSWYWFFFQTPLAEAAIRHNNFAFLDRLWAEWSPGYVLPDAARAALRAAFSAPGVLEETLQYYRQLFQAPSPAEADLAAAQRIGGPIQTPTLYLHGATDGCLGVYLGEDMDALFPGGLRRVVLPAAGHFLHLEAQDRVVAEVLAFLGNPGGPA